METCGIVSYRQFIIQHFPLFGGTLKGLLEFNFFMIIIIVITFIYIN